MRLGALINGYRVVSEPTNNGGGKCVWAFAEKDGGDYFIKRFLDPKRPREGSTAPSESQALRLRECEEFEAHHTMVKALLLPEAAGGGNLVLALDFFHEGTTYYKVTERIDAVELDHLWSLSPDQKLVLLKTLGLSWGSCTASIWFTAI